MKRKITFLLGLSLVAGLMFTACDKDEETIPQEKKLYPNKITAYEDGVYDGEMTFEYNTDKKITKIDYGYGYYEAFEYNDNGILIKIKEYEENELSYYDSLEYNANNQVVKIWNYYLNSSKNERSINNSLKLISSSYEKNLPVKESNELSEISLYSWRTMEYDNNGNVIKVSNFSISGTMTGYRLYEHDDNGNVIRERYYWLDGTSEPDENDYIETTYEYDDKNHFLKSLDLPFMWETHINNVLVESYIDPSETCTYNYTYIYNDDNYPVEYTQDEEWFVIEYQEL